MKVFDRVLVTHRESVIYTSPVRLADHRLVLVVDLCKARRRPLALTPKPPLDELATCENPNLYTARVVTFGGGDQIAQARVAPHPYLT